MGLCRHRMAEVLGSVRSRQTQKSKSDKLWWGHCQRRVPFRKTRNMLNCAKKKQKLHELQIRKSFAVLLVTLCCIFAKPTKVLMSSNRASFCCANSAGIPKFQQLTVCALRRHRHWYVQLLCVSLFAVRRRRSCTKRIRFSVHTLGIETGFGSGHNNSEFSRNKKSHIVILQTNKLCRSVFILYSDRVRSAFICREKC